MKVLLYWVVPVAGFSEFWPAALPGAQPAIFFAIGRRSSLFRRHFLQKPENDVALNADSSPRSANVRNSSAANPIENRTPAHAKRFGDFLNDQ
jgi:hypothetical protein